MKKAILWRQVGLWTGLGLLATAVLILLIAFWPAQEDLSDLIPPEGRYNVTILRDTWGVPHVFGTTDADAAYGLAWAHAEDDFRTIQISLLASRGELARTRQRTVQPASCRVRTI